MRGFLKGLVALTLMAAAPARAEWFEARTNHFLIYVNENEAGATDFATRLERFDLALRRLYAVADDPDRHAVPVRIFALPLEKFRSVLGFYRSQISGPMIFTAHMPKVDRKAKPGSWSSQTVLLHEYGHHFMYSNYPLAYPYWFSEGFAEFNANVTFNADSSLTLGLPANYRGEALKSGGTLSFRQFFEPEKNGFGSRPDLIYARGWLMTHYLMLHPQRKGQLGTYLSAMNRGATSLAAATTAFGDPKALYEEVISYGRGLLAAPLRIPPPDRPVEVKLRRLSEGEAAMIEIHAQSVNGVHKHVQLGHALEARKVADKYPNDPTVQVQLAEAEFIARRFDRADTAADRALALKPELIDGLIYKGRVALARATEAKATDPAIWTAARAWLLKANRLQPNSALPLYLYYQSFKTAKAKPTANAVKGLSRAHVLSPESGAIRVALARQMLEDGDGPSARSLLQTIAFEPHRRVDDNFARKTIDLLDAGKATEALAALNGDKPQDPNSDD